MTFPSNEQFLPVLNNGQPLFDPPGDENPASTDIVGNAQFPAAFFAYDGQFVYFRLRLNADPRFKTGFQNFAWGLLFDTDGNPATYEWLLTVNGLATQLNLIQNTVKVPNSFNDPAEGTDGRGTPNFSQPIVNFNIVRAGPTGDGSNFGDNPDFFLDFFIPAPILFSFLGITEATQIRLFFFTSANANNYNKDSLLNNGFSFANTFSDPVTTDDADVRAELAVQKNVTAGPTSALTGQNVTYSGSITVTNTGKSAASTVFVSDVFGLDQIGQVTINSVTGGGLAIYNPLNRTITWNIGNLGPGATQTLTFTAVGQFVTAGQRTLNTVTVTGVDVFTGQQVDPATASFNVTVIAAGGVSGSVLNAASGQPVQGVSVQLTTQAGVPVAAAITGPGGSFGFTQLQPGTYILNVTGANFQPTTQQIVVQPGQSTPVTVLLQPVPATVTGSVVDPNGNPIPGALVRLRSPFAVVLQTAVTDASGSYQITGIVPNGYTLLAEAPNFQSSVRGVSLTAGETAIANFILQPQPSAVNGQVTGPAGQPIPNALVELLNNANQQVSIVSTDENGNYAVNSLTPGNYRIRVSSPGFATTIIGFSVAPDETRTINITLAANPGVIAGTAVDAETGQPLPGTSVRIVNSAGITVVAGITDANGQYQFTTIPAGSYTVTFANEGYASRSFGANVASDQTSIVNAALAKLAGTIIGSVTDQGGNPIPDAAVRVFLNNIIVATVNTDENGVYSIHGFAPGTYTVRAEAVGFVRGVLGAAVLPFETTVVQFTLAPSPGAVAGFVTDIGGNPIPGAVIIVRENTAVGPPVGRTISDVDGSYFLGELAPGSYIVSAEAPAFQIAATGAVIAPDAASVVSFALLPSPGRIEGVILNALTGQPIIGETIEIRITNLNGTILQTTFANQDGTYVAENLPPATYNVTASGLNFQTGFGSVLVEPNVTKNVPLVLQPNPGFVMGIVTNALTGGGIPGATVKVTDENGVLTATAITDSDGRFMLIGLPPGEYTISAIQPGFQFNLVGAFVESGLTTPTSLTLFPEPGSIVGTVTPSPNGTLIQLFTNTNQFIAARIADPEGRFRFDEVAPGNFIITATAAGFITAAAGAYVESNTITDVFLRIEPLPATVSGTITAQDGTPIPNSVIQILDTNETVLGAGRSDALGQYEIGSLPAGTFFVNVSAQGFSFATGGVSLDRGENVQGLDFQLTPNPGSITGQILDITNSLPIAGATVTIRALNEQGLIAAVTTTTVFGNYVIQNLEPGPYTVVVLANGYASQFVGAVVVRDQATNANFGLSPLFGRIEGVITDTTGNRITGGGVQIRLLDDKGVLLQTLLSSTDGSFTIPNLAPGTYQLNLTAPGFVSASFSATVVAGAAANVAAALSASPGTLVGVVTNAQTGEAIPGALITVLDSNNVLLAVGVTDQSGSFSVASLPAGQVQAVVTTRNFGSITTSAIIEPEAIVSANFSLPPNPGAVTGFVTNLATGEPLVGADVEILDRSNVRIITVLTDNSGFFQALYLAPGTYTARASLAGFATDIVGFTVAPGETADASFALLTNPAAVRGTVTNAATGEPVPGIAVELLIGNTFGEPLETAVTGSNGEYEITQLIPNNYTIIANAPPGLGTGSSSLFVGPGETATVNFELQPLPAVIRGTVTDAATNNPLPNAVVRVSDPAGVIVAETTTDSGGQFLVDNLPAGDYVLIISRPDYRQSDTFVSLRPGEELVFTSELIRNPAQQTGTIVTTVEGIRTPIPGAVVSILDESLTLVGSTVTDGLGGFTLEGLGPGQYTITVSAPTFGTASAIVTIRDGVVTQPIVFSLNPTPGNLRGTVTDENGKPLERVIVHIFTLEQVLLRTVITNRQGRYGIADLAPGTYRAVFSLEEKDTETRRFRIQAGETTILNVVLKDTEDE